MTFCLLGRITPSELIQKPLTTSFNIGRRIELEDFTWEDVSGLARGLRRDAPTANRLMERIYFWTGGQPYLTQKLCDKVANTPEVVDADGVDRLCEEMFFTKRGPESDDKHLPNVGKHLLPDDESQRASLLGLYQKVLRGRRVRDTDPLVDKLRLSGITRVENGFLHVRNRIYGRVFDAAWTEANLLPELTRIKRRVRRRTMAITAALFAPIAIACAILVYGWDHYYRECIEHYADYTMKHGAPMGVGLSLAEDQVHHRQTSFRFIRKGRHGPVLKVQAIDGIGNLTTTHNVGAYLALPPDNDPSNTSTRECQWEYIRDDRGRVICERAYDKRDRLVWNFLYTQVEGEQHPGITISNGIQIDKQGYIRNPTGTGAAYVNFWRPKTGDRREGFDQVMKYFDGRRKPQPNREGSFGHRREFDDLGHVIYETNLGQDGEPALIRTATPPCATSTTTEATRSRQPFSTRTTSPCG